MSGVDISLTGVGSRLAPSSIHLARSWRVCAPVFVFAKCPGSEIQQLRSEAHLHLLPHVTVSWRPRGMRPEIFSLRAKTGR